jgi:hypothetical protein
MDILKVGIGLYEEDEGIRYKARRIETIKKT